MSAQNYYMASKPYFWQWDDGGEALAIPEGSTLIFKTQLVQIIKSLSADGLPPFGALLLLWIASGASSKRLLDELQPVVSKLVNEVVSTSKPDFGDAWEFLRMLSDLPGAQRRDKTSIPSWF